MNIDDKSKPKIRPLDKELKELGFNEEQIKTILEWVDTIPIRIYGGDEIKVEVKKGTVRVNEHLINPDDLSFNKLPHDLKIYYQWDNGYFYNPFEIPDGTVLYNPFRGEPLRHNEGGKPTPATDINGEKIMRNPFNGNICAKFLFENGIALKRWIVNDNNEWEETDIQQD